MNAKLKLSIVQAWNEAEELRHSLSTLTDNEIVQCREALEERADKIMSVLTEYVSDEDVETLLNS